MILEICKHISREEYEKESPTLIDSLNSEKQKPPNWIGKLKHHRLQHHRTNVNTRRQNKFGVNKESHDWKEGYITISQKPRLKKVKVETKKINELLTNTPACNITKLNEIIYAGTSPSDCLVSYPGHSLGVGLTPLQRCSQCILQPQLTGQPGDLRRLAVTLTPMNDHQLENSQWY